MGELKPTPPSLLLAAIFSRHSAALEWARVRLEQTWGTCGLISPAFDHSETDYYATEMGTGLIKQFWVGDTLFDPAQLANLKIQSNAWEGELSGSGDYAEARPVNIDPGYLMLNKLVLASTKDRAHRIYLRDGIYAEECLFYVAGWQARPWTYPDYQRNDFQSFFSLARELLKDRIRTSGGNWAY